MYRPTNTAVSVQGRPTVMRTGGVSEWTEKCPRCFRVSPAEDWVEVHNGVGLQIGQVSYACPVHGAFGWGWGHHGVVFQYDGPDLTEQEAIVWDLEFGWLNFQEMMRWAGKRPTVGDVHSLMKATVDSATYHDYMVRKKGIWDYD